MFETGECVTHLLYIWDKAMWHPPPVRSDYLRSYDWILCPKSEELFPQLVLHYLENQRTSAQTEMNQRYLKLEFDNVHIPQKQLNS